MMLYLAELIINNPISESFFSINTDNEINLFQFVDIIKS